MTKKSLLLLLLILFQGKIAMATGFTTIEGVKKLSPCPSSPNCVNSHHKDKKDHYITPIKHTKTREVAKQALLKVLKSYSNAKIVKVTENYIHVHFTSSFFKFVDDIEFDLSHEGVIHFKSASQTGHSDFGVNRKRMEEIKKKFNALLLI